MKSSPVASAIALCAAICASAFCSISHAIVEESISFQNGTDGYAGTFDRRISLNTNVNGADVDTTVDAFFIDGDPEDASRSDYLIRFDDIVGGGGIPSGAVILGATLDLRTTSEAVNGFSDTTESFSIYRLTQPFDSNSTLDGDFGDGDGMFTNYVDGVYTQQGEADINTGTFDHLPSESAITFDQWASADVTRAVQGWVNGGANLGMAVVSDHVDNDNGWSVHSTGSSDVASRPRLSVTYTTDPAVRVVELQQGLGGYAGTTDVALTADPEGATIDGSTVSELFIDGANDEGTSFDDPYMIRFDLDGLAPGQKVLKADLIFKSGTSSGASDSGGPFTVHQLLTPFDASSTYADFAGMAADMEAAGEVGPAATQYESIDEAELVSADVTSIVQNWLNGDDNNGIYIGPGTSNGWQIFASGAADPNLAPMLRIYTVPEPASIALLGLAACAACTASRRRP